MDRAPDSKSGCWGFKSLLACHFLSGIGSRGIRGFWMDRIKVIAEKVKQFLAGSKVELKKVTWPTPKQTLASTSVVIIVVIIVSVFLGIVDFGLTKIIKLVLG
jgi:preprotein translocase subunit SecE